MAELTLLNSLKLTKETKRIVSASFKEKLRDLPEDGWQRVYTILMKWCKFLGIKEVPDQEDMKMILFFMKKNYGDLTLDEIVNAFNLAVAHKLNVDPNHYQNFSPLYVSGILNAYKEYKTSHWGQYAIKRDEYEGKLLAQKNIPSAQDLKKDRIKSLLAIWDDFKSGEEEEVSWQAHVYYDLLIEANLINMSKDEKNKILIKAKTLLKEEKRRDVKNEFSLKSVIQEIDSHTATTPTLIVINRCKLLATQKLFENFIADGLDLREKLNLISDDRFEINQERESESSVVEKV
jgi:hypothetical protein